MSARVSRLAVAVTVMTITLPAGFARAETDPEPPTQYARLPTAEVKAADQPLPSASSGFQSLVARGAIIVRASAPTRCVPGRLLDVVADLSSRFGPVSLESTHRARSRNGRAGGARHSLHLSCRAVDFRIRARASGVMAYLRSRPEVGGLKIYRNGIIHIDNGERRSW